MKQNGYRVVLSATLVVVLTAFLFTIFFADVNPSFAASGITKSPAAARTSAVDYTEYRIKQLQGALKITEAQDTLWRNLTQVMRENAKDTDALTKEKAEQAKTMTLSSI